MNIGKQRVNGSKYTQLLRIKFDKSIPVW